MKTKCSARLAPLCLILFIFPALAQDHPGTWGPVIQWPFVPVSAANMPDGRVITWASNERYSFPGGRPEFTYTGIWNPADNSVTEIDHPEHDMFCAHQVMLENGQVFVSGGRNSGNSPWTSVFDLNTEQWVPLSNMNRGRWYPTSIALADGTVFTAIGSGGGNTGEKFDPSTGQWSILGDLNFNTDANNNNEPVILGYPSSAYGERNWWPLFGLMPNGEIFHAGPTPQMHTIDISGAGDLEQAAAPFTDWYPKHGATVMYDEGKMITAGGWVAGDNIVSTNRSHVIDLNGPSPAVSEINAMINPRKFHNAVMLPNGEVLVVGGNTSGQKFNDSGTVYAAEAWNPDSGQWRELADMSVPRNYHSIALLLTDGTVLSAGGGLCNCSADHPNGQIYYPPYLYNADGSSATRPEILTAPSAIRINDTFDVTTDADITHFSMIKMSSTTHAVNTDLRYLPVSFTGSSGTYQLTAHSNPNVLTPGYWMLYALDASGTPSVSKVVQVRSVNVDEPPVPALNVDFLGFSDLGSFQTNGSAFGSGGALRLTPNSPDVAGSVFYNTPVSIDSTTAFATSFAFSSSGTANGAEGFAFVVQGNESTMLGQGGNGLGYRFEPNSLVVEFDTASNAAGDINGNHVAVHLAGDSETPVASFAAPFDLEDGAIHRAWIEYSTVLDELNIYISADPSAPKPTNPALVVGDIDLPSAVGSLGYFGFSGATGSNTNNHDIHSWRLDVIAGETPLTIDPIIATPQPDDGPVNFSASADGVVLEYRWSFGDGTPQTDYSSSPDISHVYGAPGRYVVTLTVRDINRIEQTLQFVQSVHPQKTPQQPTSSTTIIVENLTGLERVWNVNPDNNSVTIINAETGNKIDEISVGKDPRALTLAPNNTIWVTNKDDATISIIDANTMSVVATHSLPAWSRPHGIVAHESSGFVYVTLEQLGVVRKLSISDAGFWQDADVGPNPRHITVTGDESRLYVSRFISPPYTDEHTTDPKTTKVEGASTVPVGGEVIALDPSTMTTSSTIVLEYSSRQPAEITGPGFPNYLGPAIVSPSGDMAWVPSKQDDILRGSSRNGDPLNHDHTVRAVTSVIELATEAENIGLRVDHDNSSTARNGTFDPYGIFLFVALEGNREVAVIDVYTFQEMMRFDVGFAPQSIATSADGTKLFVHNFLSRSVSIIDTFDLINGVSETVSVIGTVNTTANEMLSSQVLLGKQLFYDARDPRLALESYMSCASCHNDGGHDGRVWDLSNMGEGLRNTISLKGHGGMYHGPLHWSANFDEVQDFENQIRDLAGGTGLMTNSDFAATQELLGQRKTGLSGDLDALAAYVASLNKVEPSPYREANGDLTADGVVGKAIFEDTGCDGCHGGARMTDSVTGVRHDIGTITTASGSRLGSVEDPITAIDSPTLFGLWATAPYLHDGSARSLEDAVLAHDAAALGGATFAANELSSLVAYLLQIDQREAQVTPGSWQSQDIGAVGAAGSYGESAGTFTVQASGSDIWDQADEFHFVYQTLSGDGEIVAQVSSLALSNSWAKAGVMMRESLAADSVFADVVVTPSKGADMQYRTTTGADAASLYDSDTSVAPPAWVRLVRAGDVFTGYVSDDGLNWVQEGQFTISMPSVVYIGLATTSHNDGSLTTAVFENVSITPDGPPPSDTTAPSVPQNVTGSATGPTTISLSWSASSDSESGVGGYKVYRNNGFLQNVTGTSFDDNGLSPGTTYNYTVSAFDNSPQLNESAQSSPAVSVTTDSEDPPPTDTTAPTTPTGLSATVAGPYQVDLNWSASTDSESGVAGYRVFVNGSLAGTTASTSFSATGLDPNTSYTFTVLAFDASPAANESQQSDPVSATTAVPASWQSQDIGAVGAAGSYNESGGTFTVQASGRDIWDQADEFHFVYQTLSGDGEIVARVSSLTLSHAWAKAGVMMRESLATDSVFADVVVTPINGADMQYRAATGAAAESLYDNDRSVAPPTWVRLVRTGDVFTGYVSGDGLNWVQEGQFTISMPSVVYIGLAATSHNDGSLTTAVFENVSITPDGPPPSDTTAPSVPQNVTGSATGPTTISLSWSASSDSESGVGGYKVYRNNSFLQNVTGTSFDDNGLSPGTTYNYTVSAFDNSPQLNESAQSSPAVSVTTDSDGPPPSDTTAPSVPQNVTGSATGPTTISLSWSASSDSESGVGGYKVYRNNGFLQNVTGTSFDDNGLSPGTTYNYTVSAFDNSPQLNESAQSSPAVSVTTDSEDPPPTDTTAPTTPTGLSATVAGPYQVDLNWSASTDSESGVAGYRVFVNGSLAGTTASTSFSATGLDPNTSYTFTVLAFDASPAANESQQSDPVSATTAVPASWQSQDIGAVGAAGSYNESGGTFTVQASGRDIWDQADEFHFVYQTLSGDGEIVARVSSLTLSHAWAKAGVMMRESLATDSVFADVVVTPINGADMQYRAATGAAAESLYDNDRSVAPPTWVRLVRAGDVFTGYVSDDGVNWVQEGQFTISMPSVVYIGLAATSHNDGSLTTAVFENVSITPDGPPPSDTTAPTTPTGLSATVAGPYQVDLNWSASTDSESGVAGYRVFVNGSLAGTTASTSFSATGLDPNTSYTFTVLAFDASPAANESQQSDPVSATTAVPASWQSQDIGAVGAAGSYNESGGTFTVQASGRDIWDQADEFHFVYQTLSGDGEIVARVSSLTLSHAWAKAGVMMRESLATDSVFADVVVTPINGADMQYRAATGAAAESLYDNDRSVAPPTWVRLVRAGDVFTGYVSDDGVNWVQEGQFTISMPSVVYIGLAATSHNDGSLTTAVFDNVGVMPTIP